ncbi:hypothetical protein [Microlunatus parietis]
MGKWTALGAAEALSTFLAESMPQGWLGGEGALGPVKTGRVAVPAVAALRSGSGLSARCPTIAPARQRGTHVEQTRLGSPP